MRTRWLMERTNAWLSGILGGKGSKWQNGFEKAATELTKTIGRMTSADGGFANKADQDNLKSIRDSYVSAVGVHDRYEEFKKNYDVIPKDMDARFAEAIVYEIEDAIDKLKDYKTVVVAVAPVVKTKDIVTEVPKDTSGMEIVGSIELYGGKFNIYHVTTFEASKKLGEHRGNWCLSAVDTYFDSYNKNSYGTYMAIGDSKVISCIDFLHKFLDDREISYSLSNSNTTKVESMQSPLAVAMATNQKHDQAYNISDIKFVNIHGDDVTEVMHRTVYKKVISAWKDMKSSYNYKKAMDDFSKIMSGEYVQKGAVLPFITGIVVGKFKYNILPQSILTEYDSLINGILEDYNIHFTGVSIFAFIQSFVCMGSHGNIHEIQQDHNEKLPGISITEYTTDVFNRTVKFIKSVYDFIDNYDLPYETFLKWFNRMSKTSNTNIDIDIRTDNIYKELQFNNNGYEFRKQDVWSKMSDSGVGKIIDIVTNDIHKRQTININPTKVLIGKSIFNDIVTSVVSGHGSYIQVNNKEIYI